MKFKVRDREHTGICSACGHEARLHYDGARMIGCAGATRLAPVDRGRLLQLKLQQNETAREDARASIRPIPSGKFQARLGGRMHGHWKVFPTRPQAEQAVDEFYNERSTTMVVDQTTHVKDESDGHASR